MVDRINEERWSAGVPELALDDDLMKRAQAWAEHLTTDFRHSTWSEVTEFAESIGVAPEAISVAKTLPEQDFSLGSGMIL